jgi:hypothetical protein
LQHQEVLSNNARIIHVRHATKTAIAFEHITARSAATANCGSAITGVSTFVHTHNQLRSTSDATRQRFAAYSPDQGASSPSRQQLARPTMKAPFTLLLSLMLLALTCRAQPADEAALVIEGLQCRGNTATSCAFILRHVYLDAGDAVDEQEISNAWFRLSALPNFQTVNIFLEKGSRRGATQVVVAVTERDALTTEIALSGRYIDEVASLAVAGRLSQQNLFGKGKILDLTIGGALPVDGTERQKGVVAELEYIDPQLFDSRRYFLFGGLRFEDSQTRYRDTALNQAGDFSNNQSTGLGIGIGRRLWDYSFITASYEYRFKADREFRISSPDGSIEADRETSPNVWSLTYGWQSEDDPYFPTRGSRFQFGARRAGDDSDFLIGYRHTWRTANEGLWSLKLGATPGTEYRSALLQDFGMSVGYARSLQLAQESSTARSRWYVELGSTRTQYSERDGLSAEVGIKAGVRLFRESFGVIDFSLIGTTIVGGGFAP